jgi:hypothetical protein
MHRDPFSGIVGERRQRMPAVASLEELRAVEADLASVKAHEPQGYEELAAIFRKHRKVGYKNICKLMLGEATPEKLKGSGE